MPANYPAAHHTILFSNKRCQFKKFSHNLELVHPTTCLPSPVQRPSGLLNLDD
jgi:hypothetical protein